MPQNSWLRSWLVYSLLVLTHVLGLLLFLKGFFPSKVVLPGFNSFNGISPFEETGHAKFDNVVVMVVDALRADFMFSKTHSNMKFLHELIRNGDALPFTAFSSPPTVTLPRLKGITTGGAPSFLDAILNVADENDKSQGLINQDNWVTQFSQNKSRKIDFFGDDTWLKLFPPGEIFEEFDGTNSFFVSDFTEVDNNVTRHIDKKLSDTSWNGLILHYLGLDHIGHKGGPDSVYMRPKQIEMDNIIRRIYSYSSVSNTLFVVMGDHGMNEIGNHGGSSPGETSPGMVFISPRFRTLEKTLEAPVEESEDFTYYRKINQVDIVPTLAALLNFPIPKNNIGIMISEFLDLWSGEASKLKVLKENCIQIMSLLNSSSNGNIDSQLLEKWDSDVLTGNGIAKFYSFLMSSQEVLTSASTDYKYDYIFSGFGILLISALLTFIVLLTFIRLKKRHIYSMSLPIMSFILYLAHFHGSSLIEEEHQIWWFIAIMGIAALTINLEVKPKIHLFGLLVCARIIRSWSNSGQKFTVTNATALNLSANPNLLWFLIVLTYITVVLSLYTQGGLSKTLGNPNGPMDFKNRSNFIVFVTASVVTSISFSFKLNQYFIDGNNVPTWLRWYFIWMNESFHISVEAQDKIMVQEMNVQISQFFYICIMASLILRLFLSKVGNKKYGTLTDINNIMCVLLIHLTRVEVIPIFMVFFLTKYCFANIIRCNMDQFYKDLNFLIFVISSFVLVAQNLSFFSIGNTNSLSSVDLSNAYNGVRSYNLFLVGLLTFLSTFGTPIYWSLASVQLIFESELVTFDLIKNINIFKTKRSRKDIYLLKAFIFLTFYSFAAVSLVASCINLRFHLFVWTVFSPKLLYFASWSVLLNSLFESSLLFLM